MKKNKFKYNLLVRKIISIIIFFGIGWFGFVYIYSNFEKNGIYFFIFLFFGLIQIIEIFRK